MNKNIVFKPTFLNRINKPIRNGSRSPVELKNCTISPRLRNIRVKEQSIDINSLRFIDENLFSYNMQYKSMIKNMENDMNIWIDQENPEATDVLIQIAQLSEIHRSIVLKIADILQSNQIAINDDYHKDLHCEIQKLEDQLLDLRQNIEERSVLDKIQNEIDIEKKKNLELRRYYNIYSNLTNKTGFQPELLVKTSNKTENTAVFNEVWGENHHLRNEINTLTNKISEQREYHMSYTSEKARKAMVSYINKLGLKGGLK